LAFAGGLAPGPVGVDPQSTAYGWIAPPECPDAAHVRETIEYYAARPLAETGLVLRAADGEISQEPSGGYRLRLRMDVAQGTPVERVLRDASCDVLAATAALMIAVTVDPTAATRATPLRETRPPPVEPTPAPQPEPPPERPPPQVAPLDTPARRNCDAGRSRLRAAIRDLRPCVALEVRAGMQLGLLPKIVGAGVGLDVALTWSRLRVEIGGSHWFRRPARVAGDPPRGGDLQLSSGSLGLCARLGRRKIEVPLCAGAELGAIHGRGVGIDAPKAERVLWAAAWLGPRVLWVLRPRLVLLGGVDLVVPLARYRFQIDGIGVVHRVDPVGGRFRLGLGVRL
jgi:hypothetical protein